MVADGRTVTKVSLALAKVGNPTGTFQVQIGWSVADIWQTADPVSVAALTTTPTWVDIPFPTPWALTNYLSGSANGFTASNAKIFVGAPSGSTPGNCLLVGVDTTSPTDPHGYYYWYNNVTSAWESTGPVATTDLIYRTYVAPWSHVAVPYDSPNLTGTGPTTSRLTGGTGSFVTGEVTEDGTANGIALTGNNYTELLFSFTLVAADLTNGQTLRFKIARNDTSTFMTYTVMPSLNITVVTGPGPVALVASSSGISTTTAVIAKDVPLGATVAASSTVTSAMRVALPLAAAASGISTVTSALTVALAPIPLVGQAGGTSTTTAVLARAVPFAAASAGVATDTAVTAVARALVSSAAGTSTVTAAMTIAVTHDLAATSAGQGAATGALARAVALSATVGGAPTTTLIDDTFDGPVSTPLTSVGWVSDQYSEMLVLDGAGSAIVHDPMTSGGATHLTPLPLDCWQEWGLTLDARPLEGDTEIYLQWRMPAALWYHGYNVRLSYWKTSSPPDSMLILRNDSASGTVPRFPVTFQVENVVRIEHLGATLTVWLNGTQVVTWTDPVPLTGGAVVGPYSGIALNSGSIPVGDTKLKSYRAGGLGVYISTVTADLTVTKAQVTLVGAAGGTSTVTSALALAKPLVGASAATSTVTAASPAVARALVASSAALSSASATSLINAVTLSTAAAAGTSTTTSAFVVTRGLASSAAGTANTTAALGVARPLAASATGGSTVTATIVKAVPLASSAAGAATTTAAIIVARTLVAGAAGISTTTANLIVARTFVASAAGVATTSANMVSSGAGGMAAQVNATSTVTAALRVAKALSASAAGTSAPTAALSKVVPLAAASSGLSTTVAATAVAKRLVGSSAGTSTVTSSFVGVVSMAASSGGTSAPTAALARAVPMASVVNGSSTVTVAARIARAMTASTAGSSTATAAIRFARALVATTADGLSTADGDLLLSLGLEGASVGLSDVVSDMTVTQYVTIIGWWNGQETVNMQYGDKPVIDWLLIPS